jgi:hypothetical protein
MNRDRKIASMSLGLACVMLGICATIVAQTNSIDVAVVVHPDTPVSDLSLADVR